MKKLNILLLSLLMLGSMTSCHRASEPIEQLEELSVRVREKSANWTDTDWDDAVQYADELVQTLEDCDLTIEEQEQVEAIKAEFWPLIVRHYMKDEDLPSDTVPEMSEFYEALDSATDTPIRTEEANK